MSSERARQLFGQCKDTYNKCIGRYDVQYCFKGIEMMGPNEFDDEFNVPAILLFEELCKHHRKINGHYDSFRYNLFESIYLNKDFNEQQLMHISLPAASYQKYKVHFEIFFRKATTSAKLPFRYEITANKIKFAWCSQHTVTAAFNSYQTCCKKNSSIPPFTIDQQRSLYFPKLTEVDKKNIYSITTTVNATDAFDAMEIALSSFEIVRNAIDIAQALGSQSIQFFGKRQTGPAVLYTGICIATNISNRNDSLLSKPAEKVYELPKQKLDFTNASSRMQLFRDIIKALNDNDAVISKRIRPVANELSLAYSTYNPGLRQLSYWRCLEIATVKSGENRKEKDIIKIFQNYYSNQFWKQMGEVVLKLRNTYVHQGELIDSGGFSSDYYLNWSQQYAEKALLILLYLYKHRAIWGNEQQINNFFDHYAESNDSLKVAQQILSARLRHKP